MEDYLLLLKRRLFRSQNHVSNYEAGKNDLSSEGMRSYGYYQGRVSVLEDAIDEIEEFLKNASK